MDIKQTDLYEEPTVVDKQTIAPGEIVIGELRGFDEESRPLVCFGENYKVPIAALSTVSVNREHINRQVALLFNNGDLNKPVIMGLIHSPLLDILNNIEIVDSSLESENGEIDPLEDVDASQAQKNKNENVKSIENTAYVDGRKVIIEGQEEIELRCGEASIRLTKAGKILIRGKYLLNRSSGVNRIMGGSVQVN
ncbi:DUF6484 domain-containing protein [Aliikangiella sp. G2MR2-5]|uniref:DUF6484 domain-containing protein n=1 Tax=Aliikangiella sp. G2MR2-5 TaxID=2788943 RepID=UPI0018AC4140|nr:DUF6484 domain-containing protein [Aliikangiella sp. G2MR2-5]